MKQVYGKLRLGLARAWARKLLAPAIFSVALIGALPGHAAAAMAAEPGAGAPAICAKEPQQEFAQPDDYQGQRADQLILIADALDSDYDAEPGGPVAIKSDAVGVPAFQALVALMLRPNHRMSRVDALLLARFAIELRARVKNMAIQAILGASKPQLLAQPEMAALLQNCKKVEDGYPIRGEDLPLGDARGPLLDRQCALLDPNILVSVLPQSWLRAREACEVKNMINEGAPAARKDRAKAK